MPLVRFITGLLALGLASTAVHGQTYPVKPVRLVTVAPGSANDLVARLIADELKTPFAQPVVVDNRGTIAAEVVAKAPPDGYTLLLYGSAVSISPFIHRSEAHSPLKDLLPITLVASSDDAQRVRGDHQGRDGEMGGGHQGGQYSHAAIDSAA